MNFRFVSESPLWTSAGWTMLHVFWVGAVIGVLAALSRRLMRSVSPEVRYAAALFWLAVLAAAPVTIFVCVFQPRVLDSKLAISSALRSPARGDGARANKEPMAVMPERSGNRVRLDSMISTSEEVRSRLEAVVPCLPAFWLAGSLLALLVLFSGLVGVSRLRRSCRMITGGELPRRVQMLADSLGIAHRVSVGICDRLAVPVLVGVIRPLILLPPAALCGWSADQLEMVLLHELAHLRRWDNLINIMQRVVESMLFFHPSVWWLSRWLCLERESCCDALVVGRKGQAVAYAEVLAALAGSRRQKRATVLGMADRMVTTRIRRLFKVEDQSMKLTVPEGIGLVGAVMVGTCLGLAVQAAQQATRTESSDALRESLATASRAVVALPREGMKFDFTVDTLANIAKAQMKLGDRVAALATLRTAYNLMDRVDARKGDFALLGSLIQVGRYQRELGDMAAARITLTRMVKLVESLEAQPFVDEVIQVTGTKEPIRKKLEMNATIRCELLLLNAEEQLALGDTDRSLLTCRRALQTIESQEGVLKPTFLACVAISMHKAGDQKCARDVIEAARRLAGELPDLREKERALAEATRALAEMGDIAGALQLAASLGKYGTASAIERIIASFTEDEPGEAWLPVSGIKITIGAPSIRIKDRERGRIALPRLVNAAVAIDDRLIKARTLSTLAHLQAKLGEFDDAIATTESIPVIKRQDFPGPCDGFYDAIKPATLAIVARLQFGGGGKARGRDRLLEAVSLSRAIESADQKIISQIVIIRKLFGCGESKMAQTVLQDTISLTRQQPEPLRSRSLVLLAEAQAQALDLAGAEETTRLIRQFPGLERAHALNDLAARYTEKGDRRQAIIFYREALNCVLSKMPSDAQSQMGEAKPPGPVSMRSFVDFEYELEPAVLENQRQMSAMFLHANLGEIEKAVRIARSMAPGMSDVALGNLAGHLARNDQMAEAMKLAANIESPEGKLTAYDLVAIAIRDGRAKH